jgi:hypothetical protein
MVSSERASSSQEVVEMLAMLASSSQLLPYSSLRNRNIFSDIFAMPSRRLVTLQLNLSATNGVSSSLVH